jgi:phosphoribosylformimino-5-aminoimidazole carboxamide ribotide isomerase
MRVLPVIDLKRGEVVRGVGGRRDEYRAISSRLCADARPSSVARAFVEAGFRAVYVADLDAIAGAKPAWTDYEAIIEQGLNLSVDAGISTAAGAGPLLEFAARQPGLSGIVAGLESIAGPEELERLCAELGPSRLIFSLDLKAGRPLVRGAAWPGLTAEQIATCAIRHGVRRIIVLDLAAVGMGGGAGTEPLCRLLRCRDPQLELIAGGGVRGPNDLQSLAVAGCDAALVASALHDGRLDPQACAAMQ